MTKLKWEKQGDWWHEKKWKRSFSRWGLVFYIYMFILSNWVNILRALKPPGLWWRLIVWQLKEQLLILYSELQLLLKIFKLQNIHQSLCYLNFLFFNGFFVCEKCVIANLFCNSKIEMDSSNLVYDLRWNADYDAWLDSFLIPQIYCFKSTVLWYDSIIKSVLQGWLSAAKYLTIWEPCVTHLFWFGKTIVSHP